MDASVLADALLDDGPTGDQARHALFADDQWAAPNHVFVEIMSVVRGRLLGRKVSLERADEAVSALEELVLDKIDPARLIGRVWELRDNITAYDAAYVATAELLDCPLLIGNRRLARARGIRCQIHVVDDE